MLSFIFHKAKILKTECFGDPEICHSSLLTVVSRQSSKSLTFPSYLPTLSHSPVTSIFCFCETGLSKLHIDDSLFVCIFLICKQSLACYFYLLVIVSQSNSVSFPLSQNLVGRFSCQLSVISIAWMFKQAMLPVVFWEKIYGIRYSKERSIQIPLPLRKHSGFSTSSSIFSEEKVQDK